MEGRNERDPSGACNAADAANHAVQLYDIHAVTCSPICATRVDERCVSTFSGSIRLMLQLGTGVETTRLPRLKEGPLMRGRGEERPSRSTGDVGAGAHGRDRLVRWRLEGRTRQANNAGGAYRECRCSSDEEYDSSSDG